MRQQLDNIHADIDSLSTRITAIVSTENTAPVGYICREKSIHVDHHDANASDDLLGDQVKLVKAPEEEVD